jgi:hypothetical protein
VPLALDAQQLARYCDLSGVSLDVTVTCRGGRFRENLLFTHRGLSGPAILQISSYWRPGEAIQVDLLPELPPETVPFNFKVPPSAMSSVPPLPPSANVRDVAIKLAKASLSVPLRLTCAAVAVGPS